MNITTDWLVSLGFCKYDDWLQIETLPGIYLAWDGEGLRLEDVMIPGPQTRQRVFDIFEAFGLDDYSLTEAWLSGRGGKDTTHGVSIEISPSLFLSWSDTLGKLWLGGVELPGPYTKDRVLAIMNAIGMCQPQRFHSYYHKTGELWSCIGISEPVMVLPPTQLYAARLNTFPNGSWENIAIFSRGQNTLVHARGIADHTLVILRRDSLVACPLETFKNSKEPSMGILVNDDCLNYMKGLKANSVECVFMDPPDNLGLRYNSYDDRKPYYLEWLESVIGEACRVGKTTWVSYYHRYDLDVSNMIVTKHILTHDWRKIIWRYTFGQYNSKDFTSGYRILLRLCKRDVAIMRPEAILEESERQRIGDKRAVATGKVPDDVWDFPRVVGNSIERCPWHPTQHPVVIYDRIMKFSCTPHGNFLDLFAGTGTCFRAELLNPGVKTIGVEIDNTYCERILQSHKHVSKYF